MECVNILLATVNILFKKNLIDQFKRLKKFFSKDTNKKSFKVQKKIFGPKIFFQQY